MKNRKNPIIALAPIKYFNMSRNDNFEKIIYYIGLAKKANADIICFPESCIHRNKSLSLNSGLIKEIREACKKNSIWCIITDDIEIKGKVYNLAILIGRDGKIKGKYKKMHLYGDEVDPGRYVKVFETDFAKIGIAICWDLAFPKLFKKMKEKGAEIIFCPSEWCYEEKAHDKDHAKGEVNLLRSLVCVRAFENLCFVAICNPLTDESDQVSYSSIVSPHKILKETIKDEKIMVAELDLKEIKKLDRIYDKYL